MNKTVSEACSEIIPTEEGVYLYGEYDDGKETGREEIEVYMHPVKGLCCYAPDYGGEGEGTHENDCHVPVKFTGLAFLTKLRDFEKWLG